MGIFDKLFGANGAKAEAPATPNEAPNFDDAIPAGFHDTLATSPTEAEPPQPFLAQAEVAAPTPTAAFLPTNESVLPETLQTEVIDNVPEIVSDKVYPLVPSTALPVEATPSIPEIVRESGMIASNNETMIAPPAPESFPTASDATFFNELPTDTTPPAEVDRFEIPTEEQIAPPTPPAPPTE